MTKDGLWMELRNFAHLESLESIHAIGDSSRFLFLNL